MWTWPSERTALARSHDKLSAVLNWIPIIDCAPAREALVDAETISLIQAHDTDEMAYKAARGAARLAREQGDREAARHYARVAVRIAAVAGRVVGPLEGSKRYGKPKREIIGDRTKPTTRL